MTRLPTQLRCHRTWEGFPWHTPGGVAGGWEGWVCLLMGPLVLKYKSLKSSQWCNSPSSSIVSFGVSTVEANMLSRSIAFSALHSHRVWGARGFSLNRGFCIIPACGLSSKPEWERSFFLFIPQVTWIDITTKPLRSLEMKHLLST